MATQLTGQGNIKAAPAVGTPIAGYTYNSSSKTYNPASSMSGGSSTPSSSSSVASPNTGIPTPTIVPKTNTQSNTQVTPTSIWSNLRNIAMGAVTPQQDPFAKATNTIPKLVAAPVINTSDAKKKADEAQKIVDEDTKKKEEQKLNFKTGTFGPNNEFVYQLDANGSPTKLIARLPVANQTPTPKVEPPAKTPDTILAEEIQNGGKVKMFNEKTGQQELVEPGTPGYSAEDPKTKNAIDTATVDNDIYKNLGDGKFAKIDGLGNYSSVTETTFNNAKNMQSVIDKKNEIINGTHPLDANQQSQIDSFVKNYQSIIKRQETENANTTGATTIAMNRYGLGDQLVGAGIITGVINDGLQKIADLQTKMEGTISDMRQSFLKDDMAMLQTSYNEYVASNKYIQDEIIKARDAVNETNKVNKAIEIDSMIADLYSKGITDPIEIQQELAKKGTSVASTTIGTTLNTIEKSKADNEKKQTDVANLAQNQGDFASASKIMMLDPRSPTFLQDLTKLQNNLHAKATETEKAQYEVNNTYDRFDKMKGSDNYVDPYSYLRLRADSTLSPSEFDARFGHFINPDPKSQELVGLKQQTGTLYNSKNIPTNIRNEVVDDLTNVKNLTLNELMAAYPEVDTTYLTDLFNNK